MPEYVFELTVIFFALTNLPVTFQTMMNDLLRNMIEAEDVVVFIDNVMVGIETEKEHNNIVEEVLRRMTENNLFVKPEKCVQKIREVRFLGVVIEPDKVKIEKEKVQEVVVWLVPRSMKNVQKFLGLANYYRWFIKNFARVVKPLHEIMRKDVK